MENRQVEYRRVQARAAAILRDGAGEFLARHGVRHAACRLLRLTEEPAFGNDVSWTVLEGGRGSGREAHVVELTWDQPFDRSRFLDPMLGLKHGFAEEPSIASRVCCIETARIEGLLQRLARILVPAVPAEGMLGLDGVTYTLSARSGMSEVSWSWFCDGPPEWRDLVAWAEDARTMLRAAMEARPVPPP